MLRKGSQLLVLYMILVLLISCVPQARESSAVLTPTSEVASSLISQSATATTPVALNIPPLDALHYPSEDRQTDISTESLYSGYRLVDNDTESRRRFYSPNGLNYFEIGVQVPYEFALITRLRGVYINGELLEYEDYWYGGSSALYPGWLSCDEIWLGSEVYNIASDMFYPSIHPADLDDDAVPYGCFPNKDASLIFFVYEINSNRLSDPPQPIDERGKCLLYVYHTADASWQRINVR